MSVRDSSRVSPWCEYEEFEEARKGGSPGVSFQETPRATGVSMKISGLTVIRV